MSKLKGFEKFTKTNRSCMPKISIRKNGQIGFNTIFAEKYIKKETIPEVNYAYLYYNKKENKIAIAFAIYGNEEGAIKITKNRNNFFISGKAFLDYYEIPYGKKKMYIPMYDELIRTAFIIL